MTIRTTGAGFAALLAYSLLVSGLQHWSGAQQAAFDAYPDEPAHYVSGLMVRAYLTSGLSVSPTVFAEDYYLRVPYFAVGYWPPLFYIVEALWMLVFGPGRGPVLMLIALIVALSATLIFAVLRASLGNLAAFGFGLIFLMLPVVEAASRMVMTDLAVTLLGFGALLGLGAYLRSGEIAPLLIFTVLTSMTILTKGSGLYLTSILPAVVILTGRFRWMLRPSFWLAPLGIALLCGPWYIFSQKFVTRGLLSRLDVTSGFHVLGWDIVRELGVLAPLAVWGTWKTLRARPVPPLLAVCAIQPVLLGAFLIGAPVRVEPRYMAPALPALLVLAGYGLYSIAKSTVRERSVVVGVTVALIALAALRSYHDRPAPVVNRIRPVAEFVLGRRGPPYRTVMVSAGGEGPMIAEIAQFEPALPARYLVRPGKVLAHMDWLGRKYELVFEKTEQIQALFDRVPLDLVIVRADAPAGSLRHERLLAETIQKSPERWQRVYPPAGQSSPYQAYEPVRSAPADPAALKRFLKDELPRLGDGTSSADPRGQKP